MLDAHPGGRNDLGLVIDNTPSPDAPPTSPQGDHPADADALFTTFVRHRDVQCPRCDYSLRNALHATCPECGEPLRLAIATETGIMGALLTTIAPALGSGVCGLIFLVLFALLPGAPALVVFMSLVLVLCGAGAILLIVMRRRFVRLSRHAQATWAVTSLVAHALLIVLFILSIFYGR